ncbi:hypothetical protein [Amaricoccus sp.]|uniref:hypothetical protein n=1 Tax=Amaricoccus sp. TaxID=1872485 RepID=UPI00261E2AB5|nr:hypothetical protein [Amaricoccus sp.]HRO12626.1 hypothetical protein [Amaricoccus sp.]
MPVAVLVLALVAYGAALVAYPRFRPWGIAAGLAAAAGLALYFTREAPPESERAGTRIAPAELTLDRIEVTPTVRGASLAGRIANGSPRYRLRDVTLKLRLRDCPAEDTPPEACPVIGESTAIARPDVPPGQIRALSAHFGFASLPPVTGTPRWDWEITALRATDD